MMVLQRLQFGVFIHCNKFLASSLELTPILNKTFPHLAKAVMAMANFYTLLKADLLDLLLHRLSRIQGEKPERLNL